MRKTIMFPVSLGLLLITILVAGPITQGVTQLVADQKKRDACYAVGVANLPTGEDQTMLQGSHAYQECLNSH